MSRQESFPSPAIKAGNGTTLHDELIAQLWSDLGGRVSQERIHQVATEVAAMFHGSTITAYIPILMRRKIRDQLRRDLPQVERQA